MRKAESGQVMLLVLVLLAIGSMLLFPLLNLSFTASKLSDTATLKTTAVYTLDGAQEYVMWKLLHTNWASEFVESGSTGSVNITNCGTNVVAYVTMRAIPGQGGMVLSGDDVIEATKTVNTSNVSKGISTLFTYTIRLEQLSSNNTQPLDAIYDVLPSGIDSYVPDSSKLRVDGGAWQSVPDPDDSNLTSKGYLKWPANYDNDGTGNFSAEADFLGIEDFDVRQVKELQFKVWGRYNTKGVYCNRVVLKPWNTVSSPQAPVNVDNPDNPGLCADGDVVEITKVAEPDFITPGVAANVTYTINMTSNYGSAVTVDRLIDYLPPGFVYLGPTSATSTDSQSDNMTDQNPQGTGSTITVNGQERYELTWETGFEIPDNKKTIGAGETVTLVFTVTATKDVSGSYFNEFYVILSATGGAGLPLGPDDLDITFAEWASNYSWNQGSVTVPTYDVTSEEDGVVLDSNLSLIIEGISISSFSFR